MTTPKSVLEAIRRLQSLGEGGVTLRDIAGSVPTDDPMELEDGVEIPEPCECSACCGE